LKKGTCTLIPSDTKRLKYQHQSYRVSFVIMSSNQTTLFLMKTERDHSTEYFCVCYSMVFSCIIIISLHHIPSVRGDTLVQIMNAYLKYTKYYSSKKEFYYFVSTFLFGTTNGMLINQILTKAKLINRCRFHNKKVQPENISMWGTS